MLIGRELFHPSSRLKPTYSHTTNALADSGRQLRLSDHESVNPFAIGLSAICGTAASGVIIERFGRDRGGRIATPRTGFTHPLWSKQ